MVDKTNHVAVREHEVKPEVKLSILQGEVSLWYNTLYLNQTRLDLAARLKLPTTEIEVEIERCQIAITYYNEKMKELF